MLKPGEEVILGKLYEKEQQMQYKQSYSCPTEGCNSILDRCHAVHPPHGALDTWECKMCGRKASMKEIIEIHETLLSQGMIKIKSEKLTGKKGFIGHVVKYCRWAGDYQGFSVTSDEVLEEVLKDIDTGILSVPSITPGGEKFDKVHVVWVSAYKAEHVYYHESLKEQLNDDDVEKTDE